MSGYTKVLLAETEDVLGDYPGEMHMLAGPLEAEQAALTYRRMPPGTGGRGSYGHSHRTQEELYLVLDGTLTFKLGDDVVEAGPGTALRVAPDTVRSVHNDSDADAILIIASAKATDYDGEIRLTQDFWPE